MGAAAGIPLKQPSPAGRPDYELYQRIRGTKQAVYEYLLNTDNLPKLHPLLISMQQIGEEASSEEGVTTALFHATDQTSICCIPKRVTFPARRWTRDDGSCWILWRVEAGMGVQLINEVHVEDSSLKDVGKAGCNLTQRTWVTAPMLVGAYVRSTAEEAHREQLKRLAKIFNDAEA